jgi:hypothetical protein
LHSNGKHAGFVVVDVVVVLVEVVEDSVNVNVEALDAIWELQFFNSK